jgi:putative oxidoreductase
MASEEGAMTYLKIGGTWLLTILLAVLMIGPGTQKFTGGTWARMFREWGYPDGFYLVIGAIEVIGGLGLLVPRIASASAIVLMCVMIGAAATQVWNGARNGVGEIVFALLLGVLAWIRWRDRMRLTSRPAPAAAQ